MQTFSNLTSDGPSSEGSSTEQAKEQAKEKAQQAAGQARSAVRTQVDQRSTDAGERVGGFASDVRSVSDQLREQGKEQPAKLAEQAAERAERLGDYLKNSDSDRILGDIEDFGRRQPWAVIAGGMALGLVASRFLKASASNRYEQRSRSQSYAQLPPRTSGTSTAGAGYSDPVPGSTVPRTAPAYDTASGFEGSR